MMWIWPCDQNWLRTGRNTIFPHYKSTGAFVCHGNHSFHWSNLLQNLMQPSPTPLMLYLKFSQWAKLVFEIFLFEGISLVTPKWLIRSGRNSNASERECLSWLSASLTKINVLAWRHHFPIISLWELFPLLKGTLLRTEMSDPTWIGQRSNQNWLRKNVEAPLQVNVSFSLPWQPLFWSNLPQDLM